MSHTLVWEVTNFARANEPFYRRGCEAKLDRELSSGEVSHIIPLNITNWEYKSVQTNLSIKLSYFKLCTVHSYDFRLWTLYFPTCFYKNIQGLWYVVFGWIKNLLDEAGELINILFETVTSLAVGRLVCHTFLNGWEVTASMPLSNFLFFLVVYSAAAKTKFKLAVKDAAKDDKLAARIVEECIAIDS